MLRVTTGSQRSLRRGRLEVWSALPEPVLLLMGGEQVEIEADLGVFSPGGDSWGGFLRGVPVRLAAAVQRGDDAPIHLRDGQKRLIHPLGPSRLDDQGRLLVPFVGEGTTPVS